MITGTRQGPIDTIIGVINAEDCLYQHGVDETDDYAIEWEEYLHHGELVKRNVHVTMKRLPSLLGEQPTV